MKFVRAGLAAFGVLLAQTGPAYSAQGPKDYVYCTAGSTSPKGPGLIVTALFQARSQTDFIETAFENYLKSSYAPYGNGWIFDEQSVSCEPFRRVRDAEVRRALLMSRVPQPKQSVYIVTFQID